MQDEEGQDFVEGKNFKKSVTKGGLIIERYHIDSDILSKKYKKDKGTYTMLTIDDVLLASKNRKNHYVYTLSKILQEYIDIKNEDSVLVVGLGNESIGADSLGSRVVNDIVVTRNIIENNIPKVSSICPSVMGLTGIESADIISGVVSKVKPNKIILIDSLCASSMSRLCRSIQITDTGIVPGSGVGNARKKIVLSSSIDRVIVVGVPMLIYLDTFIQDAVDYSDILDSIKSILASSGVDGQYLDKIYKVLKDGTRSSKYTQSVVTYKDIDMQVDAISNVISRAINRAILNVENIDEI